MRRCLSDLELAFLGLSGTNSGTSIASLRENSWSSGLSAVSASGHERPQIIDVLISPLAARKLPSKGPVNDSTESRRRLLADMISSLHCGCGGEIVMGGDVIAASSADVIEDDREQISWTIIVEPTTELYLLRTTGLCEEAGNSSQ